MYLWGYEGRPKTYMLRTSGSQSGKISVKNSNLKKSKDMISRKVSIPIVKSTWKHTNCQINMEKHTNCQINVEVHVQISAPSNRSEEGQIYTVIEINKNLGIFYEP